MDQVVSRVRLSGPLAGHGEAFAVFLAQAGYTALSAANQMRLLAHLSRWLGERGLAPGALTAERAEEFSAARRELGRVHWTSARGLGTVLEYLRRAGAIPGPAVPAAGSALDVLLARYRGYLELERGLEASTIRYYTAGARLFLAGREDSLAALAAAEVSGFVLAQCRQASTGSAKLLVTALRSVLRFLAVEGLAPPGLAAAVPAVAGRRDAGLPKALPAGQVTALLASCDRGTAAGLRDLAVLTLLARLGLPPAGPHRLRHTAATAMLAAGAPLAEVGQVLRHRSEQTTAIYAKVDLGALAALTVAWPAGAV
jgi:hypothetical protein